MIRIILSGVLGAVSIFNALSIFFDSSCKTISFGGQGRFISLNCSPYEGSHPLAGDIPAWLAALFCLILGIAILAYGAYAYFIGQGYSFDDIIDGKPFNGTKPNNISNNISNNLIEDSASLNASENISRLATLRNQGMLTKEEYETLKAQEITKVSNNLKANKEQVVLKVKSNHSIKDYSSVKNRIPPEIVQEYDETKLINYASTNDEELQNALLDNPHMSRSVLAVLASSSFSSVRYGVVLHMLCDETLLEKLSEDGDFTVRSAVAKSNNTPKHIIEKLVEDEDMRIVSSAVLTNKCDDELILFGIRRVMQNGSSGLREHFLHSLSNKKLSNKVISELIDLSIDTSSRIMILTNLMNNLEISKDNISKIFNSLFDEHYSTIQILEERFVPILNRMLQNSSTPSEIIHSLVTIDGREGFIIQAIKNKNVSDKTLMYIVNEHYKSGYKFKEYWSDDASYKRNLAYTKSILLKENLSSDVILILSKLYKKGKIHKILSNTIIAVISLLALSLMNSINRDFILGYSSLIGLIVLIPFFISTQQRFIENNKNYRAWLIYKEIKSTLSAAKPNKNEALLMSRFTK